MIGSEVGIPNWQVYCHRIGPALNRSARQQMRFPMLHAANDDLLHMTRTNKLHQRSWGLSEHILTLTCQLITSVQRQIIVPP